VAVEAPTRPTVCLTGPTACGKTEIALALAEEFPLEIVSMDSAMVYRGMDIGTAKPDAQTLARVPHHLIDIREPEDSYSAGQFAVDAAAAIDAIRARGRSPLVVGGTMLYLRALRDGLAALPARDESVRAAIDAEAALHGWGAMHERLAAVDPAAARRIERTDPQRIQRALEVHAVTGRPLSELQAQAATAAAAPIEAFALVPADREALRLRVERRFDVMVETGLVAEVERLRARPGLTRAHASMRAVGYRQIWALLDGDYGWDEARRRAVTATRQLAKRQMTWLRSDTATSRLDGGIDAAIDRLRRALETSD
jgi:tRNA dimethylallyltransferase